MQEATLRHACVHNWSLCVHEVSRGQAMQSQAKLGQTKPSQDKPSKAKRSKANAKLRFNFGRSRCILSSSKSKGKSKGFHAKLAKYLGERGGYPRQRPRGAQECPRGAQEHSSRPRILPQTLPTSTAKRSRTKHCFGKRFFSDFSQL